MSVLIKGMKIPQTCRDCKFEFYDEDWKMYLCDLNDKIRIKESYCFTGRWPDCPLVDVPTPHGRLVDADNIYTSLDGYLEFTEKEAPTIIEAESEG